MTTPTDKSLRLQDFLPYRLAVTSNLVSRRIAEAYQSRFGISIWEWRVIAILGEGEGMTAQELADSAAMDKVSVSRAVKNLVGRGVVARAAHASDGRSRLLTLTEAGRTTYQDIAPVALAEEAAMLAGLSETEVTQLADLLDRVRRAAGT